VKPRYLLIVAHGRDPLPDAVSLARKTELDIVYDQSPLTALTNVACGHPLLAEHSMIIGTLFPRHGPARPLGSLPHDAAHAIAIGGGAAALTRFWGAWTGIFLETGKHRILRDPSGLLPCYYAVTPAATFFASDVDLLLALAEVRPRIDWHAILRHHYTRGLPDAATALVGVRELLPGHSIVVPDGQLDQRTDWTPWQHVVVRQDGPGAAAAERLRRLIFHTVDSWAATCARPLVSVSGGLDSSVVAACLARSNRDVRCITLYTDDPAGDERRYARALCAHLGLPLTECHYAVDEIDIDSPVSPHLPRPVGRTLIQAYERAHLDVARSDGADAFITGNGGDNVFGYSQSAAAIIDRYLVHGLTPGLATTLLDVCRQTGCGPGEALRAAWRTRRRRRYRWPCSTMFLDREACLATQEAAHPWLDAPSGSLPGKAAHIAALLRVHHNLEPGRSAFAPVLTPLVSQPLIEACLAIPSWEWRSGGRDRAVVRHAFVADLPASIVSRRTKGGPDGVSAAILRQHREQIRSRLLEGNLARHRIVDREAIDLRFRSDMPFTGEEQVRMFDLLDTEAWTRAWTVKLANLTAQGAPSCAAPPTA
jgi:asparagine synthase (glutamine-hydrolysing)